MWTYEYDDNTKLNSKQLKIATEWFISRLEEITDCSSLENVSVRDNGITIEYTWDDYCRGCYMDTYRESYTIPNEIFFSDQCLEKWKKEEDEKRKIEEEQKRKEEQRREEEEKARRKEERDRVEYERLRAKFEGGK